MRQSHAGRNARILQGLCLAVAVGGWLGLLVFKIVRLRHGGSQFDDSFMFYRYAVHLRQGLGLSWNLDGVHTYGLTSLLWVWVVVLFSYLPLPATIAMRLTLASWVFSGVAIVAMAAAIRMNARSAQLRNGLVLLPLVGFSLMMLPMFDYMSASGMETMLALALVGLITGMVLGQVNRGIHPEWIGLVGVLLFLTRPESLLPVALLLGTSVFFVPGVTVRRVARASAILGAGVALTLICGKLYFHSFLPLPFYLKSEHPYMGYRARWYPVASALIFFKSSAVYLLLLTFLLRKCNWRMLALTGLPLLAVVLYLCTITQIMGYHSRYYVPYLPFLAVPAFLALDHYLVADDARIPQRPIMRVYGLIMVMAFLIGLVPDRAWVLLDARAESSVLAYNDLTFDPPTQTPPVLGYFAAQRAFVDGLAKTLPHGITVATTEVGYLGAMAPQVNIIDMAGLNDTEIALHGFRPGKFIERAPDVIWLPEADYTYERGILCTNPAFLENYDLYAGAFDYGLAVRKNGPYRSFIEGQLQHEWQVYYPQTTSQESLAQHVTWQSGTHVPPVTPPSM